MSKNIIIAGGGTGGEILVGQFADMFTKMKVPPIQLAFTL